MKLNEPIGVFTDSLHPSNRDLPVVYPCLDLMDPFYTTLAAAQRRCDVDNCADEACLEGQL